MVFFVFKKNRFFFTLISLVLNSLRKLSISKEVSESCLKMSSVSGMGSGPSCIGGTNELRSDCDNSPKPPPPPFCGAAVACCPTATEAASYKKKRNRNQKKQNFF